MLNGAADYTSQFKVLRHVKLRKLSPATSNYLWQEYELRSKSIDPIYNRPRADVLDPRSGWVDTDIPRDEGISTEITENTDKFAVAHSFGGIVQEFKTLGEAEKARASAVPNLNVSFSTLEEDEEDEDEEAEDKE